MKRTCLNCGSVSSHESKFCTVCGSPMEGNENGNSHCSCGAPLKPIQKFCAVCGASVSRYIPELTEEKLSPSFKNPGEQITMPSWPVRKRKAQFIVMISVLAVLIGLAVVWKFFINRITEQVEIVEIKKELLTSFFISPNDTTETLLSYNNEVFLKIPPDQIKTNDTLDIYNVLNIEAPDFADGVLKSFDFDFRHTEVFNDEVEVTFSFNREMQNHKIGEDQDVNILYYNEKTNEWEDVNAFINRDENSIRVFRSHFSCLGLVLETTRPGPMMRAHAMIPPSGIMEQIEFSEAYGRMEQYLDARAPVLVNEIFGLEFFINACQVTTLSTGIHTDVFKYPRFEKFNKITAKLGVIVDFGIFTIEMGNGNYVDAITDMSISLVKYGLGLLGWPSVAVGMVGHYLYELNKEAKAEEEQALLEQDAHSAYMKYNATENPYRKSRIQWKEFIADKAKTHVDFEWAMRQEVEDYLESYFVKHDVQESLKIKLIDTEKNRISEVIKAAFSDFMKDLTEEQEKNAIKLLSEMKEMVNSRIQIRVQVYGEVAESIAIRNLPVRIIVNEDQYLWEGVTDNAGQWWFNCTWLGLLHYGSPNTVEIEYNGLKYRQDFSIQHTSTDVRFYLDEDDIDNPDIDEVDDSPLQADYSSIAGDYYGTLIHGEVFKNPSGEYVESYPPVEESEVRFSISPDGVVSCQIQWHIDRPETEYLGAAKYTELIEGVGHVTFSPEGKYEALVKTTMVYCHYKDINNRYENTVIGESEMYVFRLVINSDAVESRLESEVLIPFKENESYTVIWYIQNSESL